MSENGNGFLTVGQTATRLNVTRQAVQAMISQGRMGAIWLLEQWAIPEAEVERITAAKKAKKPKKAA